MSKRNFSIQRETILNYLRSVKTHPTAATVYEETRKSLPNISLGTVYRNLSELKNEGEIISFTTNNVEHFDGDISEHHHFCCNLCGTVYDFDTAGFEINADLIEKNNDCIITKKTVILTGICSKCKN